jgi:hypothetical protein
MVTSDEFAEALGRLIAEAEEAGLDHETLIAALEDAAEPIRTPDH